MKTYTSNEMKRYNHLIGEIDAVYHEMAVSLGMSDSAMRILYTICDSGGQCPLQEICLRSGLSKQTVNSAIRKLEAEEIIYLESIRPKNKNVCFTDKGRHLAEHTVVQIIRAENDIFASWPEEDTKKYLEFTEKYLADITEKSRHIAREQEKKSKKEQERARKKE